MTLSINDKKAVVAQVADIAGQALSVVAAEYRGLTVSDMTELRNLSRKAGVHLQVIRNTLAKRAFEGTSFECMSDALVGQLFLAFSTEAPGDAARLLRDFAKTNDKLEVKALSLSGKLMDASHLDAVANLPTRDEAISKLMYVMKAPVEKFVRTLAEPHAQVVRCVAAIADQKKQAA